MPTIFLGGRKPEMVFAQILGKPSSLKTTYLWQFEFGSFELFNYYFGSLELVFSTCFGIFLDMYMGVSKNRGGTQIINFNRVFHHKPSILGTPIFGNTHISISPAPSGRSQKIPPKPRPKIGGKLRLSQV